MTLNCGCLQNDEARKHSSINLCLNQSFKCFVLCFNYHGNENDINLTLKNKLVKAMKKKRLTFLLIYNLCKLAVRNQMDIGTVGIMSRELTKHLHVSRIDTCWQKHLFTGRVH